MEQNKKTISINEMLLQDIESAMDNEDLETSWYFDIQNNEVTLISEYGDIDVELYESIEGDVGGERFILIPNRPSWEGWNEMEQFILSLDDQDDKTKNLLLTAIQGRGAFARFKDALFQIDLLDQWYEHKGRLDRKKALDWLYSEELITQQDIQKGINHYEEWLGRKKQREIDLDNMIAGTRVRCSDYTGHTDRLTVGTIYEVHDERQNNLLIRIRDDEGNLRWFPKSHFELVKEE